MQDLTGKMMAPAWLSTAGQAGGRAAYPRNRAAPLFSTALGPRRQTAVPSASGVPHGVPRRRDQGPCGLLGRRVGGTGGRAAYQR